MGKHCGGSREVGSRIQLDGAWSFQAQLDALRACNREEDWTFKENSVKEVTDRGRTEATARLQKALGESQLMPRQKRKAIELENDEDRKITEAMKAAEADVRKHVRALLAPLKDLEQVPRSADSDAAALAIFRQLRRLQVTVECLKSTRIAAELNKPRWRGANAAPEVRNAVTSLIKGWRSMYRAETGKSDVLDATRARKVRLQAVDLEEKIFAQCQRLKDYRRVMELVTEELMQCRDVSDRLLEGSLSGYDLVAKNAGRLRIAARAVDVVDVEEPELAQPVI